MDHNKLWETVKEMGIPDHLTCLLRNLYAGQEATVKTGHGTTDWFQIGKGVCQDCILSPCLFNLYAEYIMWNVRLEEAQAGIKITGRNINNLRYTDDTTLMAEREEELKSLLMKVKEESEKAGLKLNSQKTKIMASGSMTSWQIDGEKIETVTDLIFLRVTWTSIIKPVNPKWNQSWIYIGRTDAVAEAPVLWLLDEKSWLIRKDSDAGKRLWAGGEGGDRGWDGWMASLTWWTWVWVSSGSW